MIYHICIYIIYQISNIKYNISYIIYQISNIIYHISDIKYHNIIILIVFVKTTIFMILWCFICVDMAHNQNSRHVYTVGARLARTKFRNHLKKILVEPGMKNTCANLKHGQPRNPSEQGFLSRSVTHPLQVFRTNPSASKASTLMVSYWGRPWKTANISHKSHSLLDEDPK